MFELICMGVAGVLAGGVIGASLAAWHFYREQEKPVKLLTVGSLIRYNGRVYEIERFTTDDDNQTIAHFGDEVWEYLIPVEELEAVPE